MVSQSHQGPGLHVAHCSATLRVWWIQSLRSKKAARAIISLWQAAEIDKEGPRIFLWRDFTEGTFHSTSHLVINQKHLCSRLQGRQELFSWQHCVQLRGRGMGSDNSSFQRDETQWPSHFSSWLNGALTILLQRERILPLYRLCVVAGREGNLVVVTGKQPSLHDFLKYINFPQLYQRQKHSNKF